MAAMTEQLNPEQQRAVTAGDGPVLIVAGPGTGKTKTLTARVAHLIASKRARPDQILALTFTKKAAEEMRQRVTALLRAGRASSRRQPHSATFHALCQELLGGGEPVFIGEAERLAVVRRLPRTGRFKGLPPREIGLLISRAKNMAEDDPQLLELVAAYDATLADLGCIDFDDLLLRTRDLLSSDPAARRAAQERYTHILVDEFQDTNRLQYELLQLLRGHENLFVIGDPLQSIYGFRGASGSIFEQFRADFPQAEAITLGTNYRSVPEVVALSNAVFPAGPQLRAYASRTGRVRATQALNEYSEVAWVVSEIQRAIGGSDMLGAADSGSGLHRTLRDFAILYRSRSAGAAMQRRIAETGLPYQIVGDGSPYEQPQVQALIALLRAAHTGTLPVLEGFTSSQAAAVQALLTTGDSAQPHALAERAMELLGFERSPSLLQFLGSLVRFSSLADAVTYLDTLAETNFYDPQAEVITLLTIHASKGLEFPHVFLLAAEEGILPHAKADDGEERRLFYVAVTRAKDILDITHAVTRGGEPAVPSRFITAIPADILPRHTDPNLAADQHRLQKRAAQRRQQRLF